MDMETWKEMFGHCSEQENFSVKPRPRASWTISTESLLHHKASVVHTIYNYMLAGQTGAMRN